MQSELYIYAGRSVARNFKDKVHLDIYFRRNTYFFFSEMQIVLSTFYDMRSEQIIRMEQNKQCTYNVTLRPVRITIVAVEKQ